MKVTSIRELKGRKRCEQSLPVEDPLQLVSFPCIISRGLVIVVQFLEVGHNERVKGTPDAEK